MFEASFRIYCLHLGAFIPWKESNILSINHRNRKRSNIFIKSQSISIRLLFDLLIEKVKKNLAHHVFFFQFMFIQNHKMENHEPPVFLLINNSNDFSSDEGVYNTYIIDTDYREWALIMHCAEKPKSNRYLSALMLSRTPTVGPNVISFLRLDFIILY